jgi:hypothetical protein
MDHLKTTQRNIVIDGKDTQITEKFFKIITTKKEGPCNHPNLSYFITHDDIIINIIRFVEIGQSKESNIIMCN